jgi:hypothetical protein
MYFINKKRKHTYSYTIYGSVITTRPSNIHKHYDTLIWLTDISTDLLDGDDKRQLEVIEDTLIHRKNVNMGVKIEEWTKL